MRESELVEKDFEDIDTDTITVEAHGVKVTLPELEARAVVKAFVDSVEEEMKSQKDAKADKTNSTAYIMENADLLDEDELREVSMSNHEAYGRAEGMSKARLILSKKLNSFFQGGSDE